MEKLYIITRSDLPPGAQLAQSCHAVAAFSLAHPDEHQAWAAGPSNIVCLSAADEGSLSGLLALGRDAGFAVAEFHEPDFGGQLTAIALSGGASRLVSSLPLALKRAA